MNNHGIDHFCFLPALSNITIIGAKGAAHGTSVYRTGDVVALFDAPNVIGIERDRDKGSGSGFGDHGFEILCEHVNHLSTDCIHTF